MKLADLPIPDFLPKLDSGTIQMGNIVFIIFGSVCILIGLITLLLNRKKKNRTQNIVGGAFLVVGILSMVNNLFQYFFWN